MNVNKYPPSIWCWDSNPQPSGHESLTITTRPGLPSYSKICSSHHRLLKVFRFFKSSLPTLSTVVVSINRARRRWVPGRRATSSGSRRPDGFKSGTAGASTTDRTPTRRWDSPAPSLSTTESGTLSNSWDNKNQLSHTWLGPIVKRVWNVAMQMLHNFLGRFGHKCNSLPLGPMCTFISFY